MGKGSRGERKLVQWFENHGWYAQRTGGSGAGTDRERPDVIAMRPNKFGSDVVVVEHKSRDDGTCRFGKDEIQQLELVAEKSGGVPLIVTRPDLRSHDHLYAMHTDELKENNKSFTITKSMLPTESLETVIRNHLR